MLVRRPVAVRIGVAISIGALFLGPWTYVFFWRKAAENEGVRVAGLIARSQPLDVAADGECGALTPKLSSGFELEGSDDIPFGLRDYEVILRSTQGDLISIDVYRRNGHWRVTC